ncbi:MAG: nucleotide exchange factor GrpE [Clostridia bacterium]|nr:nucleotide exchange factor GrpE [Clostridia bacterium]
MTKAKVEEEVIKETEARAEEISDSEVAEAIIEATEECDTAADQAEEAETSEGDALQNASDEIENLKAANVRMQAEFQNFKKRVEKEKADIYKFANEKLVIELLGVMDNVERAIGSMHTSEESNKNIVDGVQMIQKTLEDFLKKHQVEVIEAVGQPFDPQKHHAVMTEASEEHPAETVLEEFQKGYELNGKVVRPSMVKVSE